MRFDIVKTENGYVLLSNEIAMDGDFSITGFGKVRQVDLNISVYWMEGCRKIVATDTSFKLDGIPQFELTLMPKDFWGVHETHCCFQHGCKYGDDDCPVVLGLINQRYDCEYCGYEETYTEEDIRKAIQLAREEVDTGLGTFSQGYSDMMYIHDEDAIVKLLRKVKELVAVEIVEVSKEYGHVDDYTQPHGFKVEPKLVISEQYPDGLYIIKEYIYE